MEKRTWGNSTLKYDPVKKVCWNISRQGNLIKYKDLPTYGIKREEIPAELNKRRK